MKRMVMLAVVVFSAAALGQETALKAGAVKLVKPRAVAATARDAVTGSLFAAKTLPLGFEVGGRLLKVRAAKGEQVKEGQVLAQLDPEIIDAQVAQAEAAVAAAEAGADLATDVAGRNEKLKAEGSVSELQNKNALTTSKQAQANVLAARAQLAQAKAGRKRHDLKTSISGVVVDAPDNAGGMVGPGTPVFIIQQLDTLVLKTTISEGAKSLIKPGQKVRVESVSSGAFTEEAVVKVVILSADPGTRRIPIEIAVPNQDGRFVANTLARATLPLGDARRAMVIPASALGTTGGEHVFSVDGAGLVKKVAVTVLERNQKDVTVVMSSPVEQVVESPPTEMVDGTRISAAP